MTLAAYLTRIPPRPGGDGLDALAATVPDGLPFVQQLRSAGLIWRLGALLSAHAIETGLVIASWTFIGSGALSGRLDPGWLAAWALCLVSLVPLRAGTRWLEGVLALGFAGLLKQRLLAGAMAIDADVVRRQGAGELLAEVLEAEQIERLGATGGIETALAAFHLLAAVFVLAWGAAARLEIALLVAWSILALILLVHNTRQRVAWTSVRFDLTHRLVENMTAHRTRAVQQRPSEWHHGEDLETGRYAEVSEGLDRSTAAIEAGIPRGYLIAALAFLMSSLVGGDLTIHQQAITFGGVLLATAALEQLCVGFTGAAAAWVAWRRAQPLFDAACDLKPDTTYGTDVRSAATKVLTAHDVVFTHQGRLEPSLKGCTLTINRGDFVLVEGGSGSGKSTLAAVLAGLRRPTAGVILAGGLDRQTLGDDVWRHRIAMVPQYHENHILSAPLGFNVLLGRAFPHSAGDLEDARAVCDELGLGPLLERMPAGFDQMVGETGWQLSQGERSRVFLARALLQDADVVLLDETLAALDPENLRQCLDCVMRRAKTLLVIAHP